MAIDEDLPVLDATAARLEGAQGDDDAAQNEDDDDDDEDEDDDEEGNCIDTSSIISNTQSSWVTVMSIVLLFVVFANVMEYHGCDGLM